MSKHIIASLQLPNYLCNESTCFEDTIIYHLKNATIWDARSNRLLLDKARHGNSVTHKHFLQLIYRIWKVLSVWTAECKSMNVKSEHDRNVRCESRLMFRLWCYNRHQNWNVVQFYFIDCAIIKQ